MGLTKQPLDNINRADAQQKSPGPRSSPGKQRSRMNVVKDNLSGQSGVLLEAEACNRMGTSMLIDPKPKSERERRIAQKLIYPAHASRSNIRRNSSVRSQSVKSGNASAPTAHTEETKRDESELASFGRIASALRSAGAVDHERGTMVSLVPDEVGFSAARSNSFSSVFNRAHCLAGCICLEPLPRPEHLLICPLYAQRQRARARAERNTPVSCYRQTL
jgi:hypothetical protein